MATVAQADGTVSPAEIKMLEKVYKVLGVDSKKVFSDVHAAAAGTTGAAPGSSTPQTGFKLDAGLRSLQLTRQRSRHSWLVFSKRTMCLLWHQVLRFRSRSWPARPRGSLVWTRPTVPLPHVAVRPQWSRSELIDVAEDLELMLDGALEHINEASFDAFDMPLTEGVDPIDVRAEV